MKQALVIFGLCLLLAACGFHVRQEVELAPAFHELQLQTPNPYSTFSLQVNKQLKAHDVQVRDESAYRLTILSENFQETINSISSTLNIRQTILNYHIRYQVSGPQGVLSPGIRTLQSTRVYSNNTSLSLGSEHEKSQIERTMARDLAYQLISQLATYEVHA